MATKGKAGNRWTLLRKRSLGLIALNRLVGKAKKHDKLTIPDDTQPTSSSLGAELAQLKSSSQYTGRRRHVFKTGDIYDGDWLFGAMEGLGIMSYSDGSKYSGDFRGNKRHGRGEFTNKKANTTYDGEWKEDQRSGEGTFTDAEGNSYTGEWDNGAMTGYGTYKFDNGDVYEGEFNNNDFNGRGRFSYSNGDLFDGTWRNGEQHGQGSFEYAQHGHRYAGEWSHDNKHGRGKYTAPDYEYDGEWRDDGMCGEGTYTYSSGDKYVGEWKADQESGHGIYYYTDGSVYDGEWAKGDRNGHGVLTSADGAKYDGDWANGNKEGYGTYFYNSGAKYAGEWADDQPHGKGIYVYSSGKKYNVEYVEGKPVKKTQAPPTPPPAKTPTPPPREPTPPPAPSTLPPTPRGAITEQTTEEPRPKSPQDPVQRARKVCDEGRHTMFALQAMLKTGVTPENHDAATADAARDSVSALMKLMTTSLPTSLKAEVNELSDQISELLTVYDELAGLQHKQEDTKTEEEKAREAEEETKKQAIEAKKAEERKREKERQQAKEMVETMRMEKVRKQKEEMEIELLKLQMEEARKQREGDSYKDEDERDFQDELDRLEREQEEMKAEMEAGVTDQLEKLKQQILDEQELSTQVAEKWQQRREEMEEEERKMQEEEKQFAADGAAEEDAYAAKVAATKAEYEEKVKAKKAELAKDKKNLNSMTKKTVIMDIDRFKRAYEKEGKERKKLYNEIQDLKGSIRVYVRVRPMKEAERQYRGGTECTVFPPSGEEIKLTTDNPANKLAQDTWHFDKVFPPGTPQLTVFQDTLPLITSVVDGYNVCIFAYGQTGSGKTWTMSGTPEQPGIMRRSLAELFRLVEERRDQETIEVMVSVLEIYNDTIHDLLVPRNEQRPKYPIKSDPLAGQYVEGLKRQTVTTPLEIDELLDSAMRNRSVTGTAMNAQSSRAHTVLYIVIDITNLETQRKSVSKLSLIDLAGSERVDKSGATGAALLEAQHINKSLSTLGNVIFALGQKSKKNQHIPYRDSTLTHLLQDSLGGQAKTLMFANASPLSGDMAETISTMNFAARVHGVSLGKAKKNVEAAA